jgi:peptidylprolyl isomerase
VHHRRRSTLLSLGLAALAVSAPNRVRAAEEAYQIGPRGLEYTDVVVGTGPSPSKGDLVVAGYRGSFAPGESGPAFDANTRFSFAVGNGEVIAGWDLAVLGEGVSLPPMKVGGKRKIKLPPSIAYGSRGAGCRGPNYCVIPPDSTLFFTIELKEIKTSAKR